MGIPTWQHWWLTGGGLTVLGIIRFLLHRRSQTPSHFARFWAWTLGVASAKWDLALVMKAAGVDPTLPGAREKMLERIAFLILNQQPSKAEPLNGSTESKAIATPLRPLLARRSSDWATAPDSKVRSTN